MNNLRPILSQYGAETAYPDTEFHAASELVTINFTKDPNTTRAFTFGTVYKTLQLLRDALEENDWKGLWFEIFDILPDENEQMVGEGYVEGPWPDDSSTQDPQKMNTTVAHLQDALELQ